MKSVVAIGSFAVAASASAVFPRGGYAYGYKPLVSAEKLKADITSDALLEGAQHLQDLAYAQPDRNRLMGGAGHNATVQWLIEELEALNGSYTVSTQTFWSIVQVNATASFFVDGEATPFGIFDFSASGNVTGSLVTVANLGCEQADYPAEVEGNIALISRGTCEFGLKSALAGNAGAIGALIYDNIPGDEVLEGTLGAPPRPEGDYVPTLGLSNSQGTGYVESIAGGAAITATLNVLTDIQNRTTNNVVATTNSGNQNSTLVVGAHTDSVAAGPGINDDGSGTVGILEVAKALSKYKVNNAVTFGFWSGEEIGLLGSTFFVETASPEKLASIRAYLNFDMIASENYIHAIYDGDGSSFNQTGPAGSAEIEHFFENYFASAGENFTATAFDGRSDYLAFIENGIPAGGTFTGAEELKTEEEAEQFGGTAGEPLDAYYHSAEDTVDKLNVEAFELHAKAIAAAVAEYAVSFESLPPKAPAQRRGLGRRMMGGRGEKGKRVKQV